MKCWWIFFHKWGKWLECEVEMISAFSSKTITRNTQIRYCTKCNKRQIVL